MTAIKYHGKQFKPAMIQALLDGDKDMTRRLITARTATINGGPTSQAQFDRLDFSQAWIDPSPSPAGNPGPYLLVPWPENGTFHRVYSRIAVGDRIYVKEAWFYNWMDDADDSHNLDEIYYRADGIPSFGGEEQGMRWESAMFMPRWAARIILEVTEVFPQRIQDITEEDVKREGCSTLYGIGGFSFRDGFKILWDSINAAKGHGWDKNEWVWAYGLKRVEETP